MNAPFTSRPVGESIPSEMMLPPLSARREVKKAVILAAGRGRRMGKLTSDRPKGALEVGGHALIDWQIEALRAAGVSDIAIVTGHGGEALSGRDVTYIENPAWKSGTQVATLFMARDWIGDDPVIVSYSDIVYDPCVPLALLERPGDIVVAYDADHRWLWRQRFRNWLSDSETFRIGPGQVLTEIGGKPRHIDELDGQFMGVMLLTPSGMDVLASRYSTAPADARKSIDFTSLIGLLIASGVRVDTAANPLPWCEVDSIRDLRICRSLATKNPNIEFGPSIAFPGDPSFEYLNDALDETVGLAGNIVDANNESAHCRIEKQQPRAKGPSSDISKYTVVNAFAIQNWGRSGSTLLQSLFDNHPQVASTPNFYSRQFYLAWAKTLSRLPDNEKIDGFLRVFSQWWDPGLVDASAGLHRLGFEGSEIAGVDKYLLESLLRSALPSGKCITRRRLFEVGHLAYALARGQTLSQDNVHILFPIHGETRAVAAAFLEDFPEAKFIHTLREPVANIASTIQHLRANNLDASKDSLFAAIAMLFDGQAARRGRSFTLFADRPYFDWLINEDRVRFLPLERLHAEPRAVLSTISRWLGLQWTPVLEVSTWDGRKWWNRPESLHDSALGIADHDRHIAAHLSKSDSERIAYLAAKSPTLSSVYGYNAREAGPRRIARSLRMLGPWRREKRARPTTLQCLLLADTVRLLLPRRVRERISASLSRERLRARLSRLNAAALIVRRKLPDGQKSASIRAALILSFSSNKWRARALVKLQDRSKQRNDDIDIVFLDEAMRRPTIADHAFWLTICLICAPLARLRTAIGLRVLLANLVLRRASKREVERGQIFNEAPVEIK